MGQMWNEGRSLTGRRSRWLVGLALLGFLATVALLPGAARAVVYYPPTAGPVTKTDQGFQLTGTVYDYGGTTTYHFEYGTSTSYGTSVPTPDAAAGTELASAVSQPLGGLQPNATYHYRLVSNNSVEGVGMSADRTFTTDATGAPLLAGAGGPTGEAPGTNPAPNGPQTPEGTSTGKGSRKVTRAVAGEGRSILATLGGRTLYSLSVETHGKFICTAASGCTAIWHPLTVPAGVTPKGPVRLGTVKRPEGATQVTYRGRPLYTFGGDKKRGQLNGVGIKDVGTWHAVFVPSPY